MKIRGDDLQKIEIDIPQDTVILFLDTVPMGFITYPREMCFYMVNANLFMIVWKWKQPNCP